MGAEIYIDRLGRLVLVDGDGRSSVVPLPPYGAPDHEHGGYVRANELLQALADERAQFDAALDRVREGLRRLIQQTADAALSRDEVERIVGEMLDAMPAPAPPLDVAEAVDAYLRAHPVEVDRSIDDGRLAAAVRAAVDAAKDELRGEPGAIGLMPRHQVRGYKLRFERKPDEWGEWIDLRELLRHVSVRGGDGGISEARVAELIQSAISGLPLAGASHVYQAVTDAAGRWSVDFSALGWSVLTGIQVQPLGSMLRSDARAATASSASGVVWRDHITDLPGRRREFAAGVSVFVTVTGT